VKIKTAVSFQNTAVSFQNTAVSFQNTAVSFQNTAVSFQQTTRLHVTAGRIVTITAIPFPCKTINNWPHENSAARACSLDLSISLKKNFHGI